MSSEIAPITKIVVFKKKEIRKTIHENEWWFSVVDVVAALTDSDKPRDYWYRMKKRVQTEDGTELSTFCRQLKLPAPDGKMREKAY
jgi:prophage antirepressor-like protein